MTDRISIPVILYDGKTIQVEVYADAHGTLEEIDHQQASENGESPYQLREGAGYEYRLTEGYEMRKSEIVRPSKIDPSRGRLLTNIYVGSLKIEILRNGEETGVVTLEIVSVKTGYRNDYRRMLEEITVRCADLLLKQSSVINQSFTVDATRDPQTLYQRFAFVDSLIRSGHFADALHRINSMPVRRWEEMEEQRDICNIRRAGRSVIRQTVSAGNRTVLPSGHSLSGQFSSLPGKVNVRGKTETTDVPENRFIHYVLETFMQFCLSVYNHPQAGSRLKHDAWASSEILARYLSLPVLKGTSSLDFLPLHSPALQRREGYREVLQAYLMFDMAASLVWQGGDDVYKGGKRDVARLYEYWLFFKLLDLLEEVFGIKPREISDIIEATDRNGEHLLELKLKSGRQLMIDGTFSTNNRNLHIEFYYNRTFSDSSRYPDGGSWTAKMRPDYTLSIRPEGLTAEEAEKRELIVHIHFDAKYRVDNTKALFPEEIDLDEEKEEQTRGNYKRADLLKMHAYKDAIRRTAGAYVLYPGDGKRAFRSFHEILPGLGAFAVSPVHDDHTVLKEFLLDVVHHFLDRASQRELYSLHTFDTFNREPGPALHEPIPERYVAGQVEHPHTTYVLVGYYKDENHLRWILKNKLYNLRTDSDQGSLQLSNETTGAAYLLLHGSGTTHTNLIFRLVSGGPRVISAEQLRKKDYPSVSGKLRPYYIGFSLESAETICGEFGNVEWEVSKLKGYQPGRRSAVPFVVTVEEMMRTLSP